MKITNIKNIIGLAALFSVAVLTLAFNPAVRANHHNDNIEPPQLPPMCSSIEVPSGNRLFHHAYALGVQTYRWDGSNWNFVAPTANLYADVNYRDETGFHYAGPTWENNHGKVVAARAEHGLLARPDDRDSVAAAPVNLTSGHGIFRRVTYIQRVNTVGGLAPTFPGSSIGAEARVPYTAEYYFYRARRND